MPWGSPTSVGTAQNGSGVATIVISGATVPAGALLLVATLEHGVAVNGAITNSVGDAFSVDSVNLNGGGSEFSMQIASTTTKGLSSGTITYTAHIPADACVMSAWYVTGQMAAPLDTVATPVNTSSSGSTISITSAAPALPGEMFFGVVGLDPGTVAVTNPGGWSVPPNNAIQGTAPNQILVGGGFILNAGSSAATWAPTIISGTHAGAMLVSYKVGTPPPNFVKLKTYLRR